jgi:predicted lipoprotein with Yx(FWY)xxD motif
MRRHLIIGVAAVGAALLLAACGGSNKSNGNSANASSKVLVDSNGAAVYLSDQEKDGTVRCTGGCTSIWLPASAGSVTQAAVSAAGGKLGTVKRPDGSSQATFDGRPLYRFAEDGGSGKVTGNGVSDSFGGQDFTWHSVGGSGSGSSSSGGSGGSGGSYSY